MTLFQSRYAGKAQVLAAALRWSSAGRLIRGVDCGMLWLLVIRNGAAGLALSPWLWREKDRFPWKQAWPASLCYALFMMAFAMSTRWVGAAAAVAGQYTAPLFVYMYLAARKKLMVRFSNAFPMGLIAAGCLIGLCAGGALSVLAVCCGVLFPLYTAGLRRCQDLSAMSVMALGNLLCAILSLPAALCTEALPAPDSAALIALAGVLVNGVAYAVYTKGAQKVEPLTCMLLCLAEPVLNPVWVWVFLGEAPDAATLGSLLLILGGGILDTLFSVLKGKRAHTSG